MYLCYTECAEERDKRLKHAHARDASPPCPDAPSTPKVGSVRTFVVYIGQQDSLQ